MLSLDTLRLCANVIDGLTLNVGADDFEAVTISVLRAKKEIAAAIKALENGNRADRRAGAKDPAKA